MASVFEFRDYRKYLAARADAAEERGVISRLAEAAQCQPSHMSRVLSLQLHLTPDQAFRVAEFWRLDEDERTYFLKLVEYDRSGDHRYRAHLAQELADLKTRQEDLAARLDRPKIGSAEQEMKYYSSWHWSAVHVITSIPRFQTPAAIATRLGLPEPVVLQTLKTLETFGLVTHARDRWIFVPAHHHLPKTSPLNAGQHANWRSRAVLDSQNPASDGVHYTVVQSVSKADFEKIKQLVLDTIDQYARVAGPSKEEELVTLAVDFFRP
jgi:Domain of unknown function (DUF4423)